MKRSQENAPVQSKLKLQRKSAPSSAPLTTSAAEKAAPISKTLNRSHFLIHSPDFSKSEVARPSQCMLCSISLSDMSEAARQLHVNSCLDKTATSNASSTPDLCPLCTLDLSSLSALARASHIQDCADDIAQPKHRSPSPVCPVCEQPLGGESLSEHVSHCAFAPDDRGLQLAASPAPRPATATSAAAATVSVSSSGSGSASAKPLIERQPYQCQMCSKDLSTCTFAARVKHLKHCSEARKPSSASKPSHPAPSAPPSAAPPVAPSTPSQQQQWKKLLNGNPDSSGSKGSQTSRGSSASGKDSKGWGSYRPRGCPAYKRVGRAIVDGFRFSSSTNTQTFFLSHCHSDHTAGLTGARFALRGLNVALQGAGTLARFTVRL